jgi:sialidase-1
MNKLMMKDQMIHRITKRIATALIIVITGCIQPVITLAQSNLAVQTKYQVPVLKGKLINPILRVKINVTQPTGATLQEINISEAGSIRLSDIQQIKIFAAGADSALLKSTQLEAKPLLAETTAAISGHTVLKGNLQLQPGVNYLWLSVTLGPEADLSALLNINITAVKLSSGNISIPVNNQANRIGIAVRQHNQDGVDTYRIPGLSTANDGSLLGIYDVRRESGRDLQGNIDIGLSRSVDKGKTWQPMQIVLDMGKWGGLPEKFNGVSDADILVDKRTGTIFVAGLWMHGLLDANGKWVEGLNEQSKDWNHQWRAKGSQPGFDVTQSAQFLITKSTDNGKTWSQPINITQMCKHADWWLLAPAPGHGITLKDGTLVFPTEGRDAKEHSFSNITYSKDGGTTWQTSNAASNQPTGENMAVELTDGSIMLNMRSSTNAKDTTGTNGRVIAVTKNLGQDWSVHPTSRHALPEPACMGSIIRHDYVVNGKQRSVLLFSNPNSKTARQHLSIQVSYDDGKTWHADKKILLDEEKSRGYSCLTSIDNDTIGILYESSQADLVFQTIKLKELL